MRLGKMLSVGEAEHAPVEEPAAAQPEPADAAASASPEPDSLEPAATPVRH